MNWKGEVIKIEKEEKKIVNTWDILAYLFSHTAYHLEG